MRRTCRVNPPRSMSPLPVSRSTSAPSVGSTLSVTSPEPVSMWRDENVETSATSTAPLPVSNDSSSPLADVTSMSPDPVSTYTFVAFPSRTVTFPDPVSSRSVDPSTPVTVMSPEPVPRLTSPDAVRRSTLPDPVWIRREPRVRSAATSAEATDTRIVPSAFVPAVVVAERSVIAHVHRCVPAAPPVGHQDHVVGIDDAQRLAAAQRAGLDVELGRVGAAALHFDYDDAA